MNEDHQLYIAVLGIVCVTGLEITAMIKGLDGQYFGIVIAAISGITGLIFGVKIGAQTEKDTVPKV